MKKIFTMALLICGVLSYAQELKVKKDQILLDSKPIASLVSKKGTYTFQTLDGKPIYSMKIKYTYLDEDTRDNYILLTDPNDENKKGVQLSYDVASAFANDEKIALQNSFKKYGFINTTGIDVEKVNQLLNDTQYKRELSPEKASIVEANNRVREFDAFVNTSAEIFKGGKNGKKIGYFKGVKIPFSIDNMIIEKNSILIFDNNNNKVAEFYPATNKLAVVNGNNYTFNTTSPVKFIQVLNRLIKIENNFGN